MPSTRWRPSALTPLFWLVSCQAASNQSVSGVRVWWKIVPAVAETRRPQPPHDRRPSRSRQDTAEPQWGQAKPSRHRSQSR